MAHQLHLIVSSPPTLPLVDPHLRFQCQDAPKVLPHHLRDSWNGPQPAVLRPPQPVPQVSLRPRPARSPELPGSPPSGTTPATRAVARTNATTTVFCEGRQVPRVLSPARTAPLHQAFCGSGQLPTRDRRTSSTASFRCPHHVKASKQSVAAGARAFTVSITDRTCPGLRPADLDNAGRPKLVEERSHRLGRAVFAKPTPIRPLQVVHQSSGTDGPSLR